MRSLPRGIIGNGILIFTLTKICVGRCAFISMPMHLKDPPSTQGKGTGLCLCTGVGRQKYEWSTIMSCVLLILNLVLGPFFEWKQNQCTKYFLTPACAYRSRPKPFSTQHNIGVCEKNIVRKNLTGAGKTRSNFNNTFYSFLFLAIVNYFLPYNRQTIQIQFSHKKCSQGKKNEESWYD